MLICGQVNPPPLGADYNGFYFSESDDVAGKARNLRGTPLRVEHNDKTHVGEVLQGWTDSSTGAMWALAEINTKNLGGAITAAAVITALGIPSNSTLTAANAAETIGTIFWNTTDESLQIATA